MKNTPARTLALLLALSLVPFAASADGFTVKVVDKEAPEELSEEIRGVLQAKAVELYDAEGLLWEFWLRKEVPAVEKAEGGEEALEAVEEITLVGAARLSREQIDFRHDPVAPGVYTLRMALQPIDGNHLGTAPNDFFFIFIRPDLDTKVDGFPDHDLMVETAQEDTVAEHPPIFNLQPTKSTEGEFPRLEPGDPDFESELVYLKFNAKLDDETFPWTVGFAYKGLGEL